MNSLCVCVWICIDTFFLPYYVCIVPHVTSLYIAFETDCDDYYDDIATLHVYICTVGEDNLQAWINPTQTDRNWQNTVTMAYQSSPHLAFYVYYR